jgi:hypothetical protein
MYLEIIKNPILLGVVAGCLTYLYLLWQSEQKPGHKHDREKTKKEISLFLPLIVGIIVCIITYGYFYISPTTDISNMNDITNTTVSEVKLDSLNVKTSTVVPKYKFVSDVPISNNLSSESPSSFHLISKGMNIPNKPIDVPDVFIETYD